MFLLLYLYQIYQDGGDYLRLRIALSRHNLDNNQEMTIPLDYRRYFISIIKTITDGSPMFKRFGEEKPGYSPYAFAVHFARIKSIETSNKQMVIRPPVIMTISTGMFEVMTAICNGAIKMMGKETVLGMSINNIRLLPDKRIKSRTVTFKIASHSVLRGREDYLNGNTKSELEESINTHLLTKLGFLNTQYNREILPSEQYPLHLVSASGIKKGVCLHYGGNLTTLRGNITLAGETPALQFLYDYGMGVRTGQGFGLLEVISEA
jgi:CRISPR-associated endoribonuclease Cas6